MPEVETRDGDHSHPNPPPCLDSLHQESIDLFTPNPRLDGESVVDVFMSITVERSVVASCRSLNP